MKHGNVFYVDSFSEEVEPDFREGAAAMADLIDQFEYKNLDRGAALGGALTQVLYDIMVLSPNIQTATGLISSCMTSASMQVELDRLEPDEDEYYN